MSGHRKEDLQSNKGPAGGRLQRAAALAAAVLLAGLYAVTFILAVLGDPGASRLLRFCFGLTIFLPIFLWVVIWCAGRLFHRQTMASLRILDSDPEERRRMEEAVARQMEADGAQGQDAEQDM